MTPTLYFLIALVFAAGVAAGWAVYAMWAETVDRIVARTDARRRVLA